MVASGLLEGSRLVPVGQAMDAKDADIEDLFDVEDYLLLYNCAFKEELDVGELPAGERIVKRIAEHRGAEFDHGLPADALLRGEDGVASSISSVTLDRFEKLFERLNGTLS
jgi:hypothetical protein